MKSGNSSYHNFVLICLGLSLLTDFHPLLAQEGDSLLLEYESEPVVVTGTRSTQVISELPNSIQVITREQIRQFPTNNILPLIAREVPGLFLNRRSLVGYGVGPNSGGNISIRGLSGSPNTQVLILVNGQPQFMGIFGHPIQDAFMRSDIERIEVIQGPATLLYGTNALGGAINIITRNTQQEGLAGSASISYGSFNTLQAHGMGSYGKKDFSITAALNHEQTDGFNSIGKDDFRNTTGFLKVKGSLGEHWKSSLEANISDSRYYFPGTTDRPVENDRRDYLRNRIALNLSNTYANMDGSIFLYRNGGDHDFSTGFSSTDFSEGLTAFQTLHWDRGKNQLTLGLDYQHVGGEAQNDSLPPPIRIGLNQELDTEEWGAYAVVNRTLSSTFSAQGGIRWTEHSLYGTFWTPSFGLSWYPKLSGLHSVKASISRGYRNPAIVDLFLFPTSNPDLQPEQGWNYDLSISQNLSAIRTHLEFTAYFLKGDNLIREVVVSAPPPQKINTGEFEHKGILFQATTHLNKGISIQSTYEFLDTSQPVLFAPKHSLALRGSFQQKKSTFNLGFSYLDGLTIHPSTRMRRDIPLWEASFRYQITPGIELFILGENLFDKEYVYELGYQMPGFSIQSGIKFK